MRSAAALLFLVALWPAQSGYALNPKRSITQYTRTVWRQVDGLPQDTISAITQTKDGYLWLGTDEGLARFDGYEFHVFNQRKGDLPSNSIAALAAGQDGSLWIGTPNGLVRYQDKKFKHYSTMDGLPDNSITKTVVDHSGVVWVVAGAFLSQLEGGKFTNYAPGQDIPLAAVRGIFEDQSSVIWAVGYSGLARLKDGKFESVIGPSIMGSDVVTSVAADAHGNLWFGGSRGLRRRTPRGEVRVYDKRDGLPDAFIRSLWLDRDGNLWVGTNGGLSRLENDRFVALAKDGQPGQDWVRVIYEDREGNLWVGTNFGLNRFRDDLFTIYSRSEGMPSDAPTTVYQDRAGRIWIGFHDAGLAVMDGDDIRNYTTRNGLASNEIFSIREDNAGNLMVATREGLSRLQNGRFTNLSFKDPLGRHRVFDALEDRQGRLWLGVSGGLFEIRNNQAHTVIPGGPLLNGAIVVLYESRDGSLWGGTYGNGLWRLKDGHSQLFTTAHGLSSNQIRSLSEDNDGNLWIGTFGGGLNALVDGRFRHFNSQNGLLSDNVSHVEDDRNGSLWLSTTQGISKVRIHELRDFASGKTGSFSAVHFGVEDGLRSPQCAPGYPTSSGGTRSRDGRLWFPTSSGLAVLDPNTPKPKAMAPPVHLVDLIVNNNPLDFSRPAEVSPGEGQAQIRYTGIHLRAPEQLRFSYMLEGLDRDWVEAANTRVVNYNSLRPGNYRFVVRAGTASGPPTVTSYSFVLLPHFYETIWFGCLVVAAAAVGVVLAYRGRLRQMRGRFALVLQERARMARELHDTLAQGFVGISSQLDAVAMIMPDNAGPVHQHLEVARRMARHSLTEARRAVMDLRTSALDGRDLPDALNAEIKLWTTGSQLHLHVNVDGEFQNLPAQVEQNLLRIAQEAVSNVLKHANACNLWIYLTRQTGSIDLRVKDDGSGFVPPDGFAPQDGHFGLIGMRERAKCLRGELHITSRPGQGTTVEVSVPSYGRR
jgi:ligand-binding sensor domain-containing protein/two-component sensor histidine kinase